jgi:hypothetical protein
MNYSPSRIHHQGELMSRLDDLKGFQRARKKRRSLEEKTKIFETNAQIAKLSIDKQLLVQLLQEENRSHDEAIKELDETLQEENRVHDEAVKELDEKIADLEEQIKLSSPVDSVPSETSSEPAEDVLEDPEESSIDIDDGSDEGLLQESARALSQEPEAPEETPKKKKRSLF